MTILTCPKADENRVCYPAKTAFGLTEQEILTLPHESITQSRKTFFSYRDVRNLAIRKFNAGACRIEVHFPGQVVSRGRMVRVFRKLKQKTRRRARTNWMDMEECLPSHIVDQMLERESEAKQPNPAENASAALESK